MATARIRKYMATQRREAEHGRGGENRTGVPQGRGGREQGRTPSAMMSIEFSCVLVNACHTAFSVTKTGSRNPSSMRKVGIDDAVTWGCPESCENQRIPCAEHRGFSLANEATCWASDRCVLSEEGDSGTLAEEIDAEGEQLSEPFPSLSHPTPSPQSCLANSLPVSLERLSHAVAHCPALRW